MIKKLVEIYSDESSEESFFLFTHGIKNDSEKAKNYLLKYYIAEELYVDKWKPIQDKIFQNQKRGLPELMFKDVYSQLAIIGGALFEKKDFESLITCMKRIGDQNLIIIQNDFGNTISYPPLRMKFPVNITWEELMSGNVISIALVTMGINEYFVFSESGMWGKYVASDYKYPLDIIGFKPEFTHIFKEQFQLSDEDRKQVQEWLPPKYKDKMVG